MRKVKAWVLFGKRVWLSLGVGWAIALVGVLLDMGIDQAGAMLICGAIVAEVLHEKKHRYFVNQVQPGIKDVYIYKEVDVSGENRKDIEITPHKNQWGTICTVNTAPWPLYHLARPIEFYSDENTRFWDLDRTMKRAERVLDYSIVFTAIAGTILAAFG